MKRNFLIISFLLLFFTGSSFAQSNPYKYVVIPIKFPAISKDVNPYSMSSKTLQILSDKGIKAVFQGNELPSEPCDGLTLDLENASSMFRSGVRVSLRNCKNEDVWEGSGRGLSKDYVIGYGEALEESFMNLKELPINSMSATSKGIANDGSVTTNDASLHSNKEDLYIAKNLYYNYSYIVDLIDTDNGVKVLKVINGALLGYKKLQDIAVLTPSGIDNSYLIVWITNNGVKISGVAKLELKKLTISLQSESGTKIMEFLKS